MESLQFTHQTQEWATIAHNLWEARKKRMYYEKLEQDFLNKLKISSNNTPSRANGFLFSYLERKGNIDYSLIPELVGLNLEQHRNPSVIVWKLEKE